MPFGCGYEDVICRENNLSYLSNLKIRVKDTLFQKRKIQLDQILAKVKPKVILLDLIYTTDVVLLYAYVKSHDAKIVYISPMASLERTLTAPPLNCPFVPNSQLEVAQFWKSYNYSKEKADISKKIKFLYFDDQSILKDKIKAFDNLSFDFPYVRKNISGNGKFANIPQLVLIPREFEFQPCLPNKDQYYVGFQFNLRDEKNDANYNEVMQLIFTQKRKGKKIIYCSFGSMYNSHQKAITILITKIFEAIDNIDNVFLIISLNKKIARHLTVDQDKVFIFDYVPQLSVLDHCSIFISHGGLNSVKESIYKNVPLLTFPLNQDWDHNGNSARVTYHQIGMKGNIQETDSISIKHQLVYLLENEEFFKENLEKLKMADRYYDEIYFLDTFNQLVGG